VSAKDAAVGVKTHLTAKGEISIQQIYAGKRDETVIK
jgi:hypothetical protein